jgi:hypothetical protein
MFATLFGSNTKINSSKKVLIYKEAARDQAQ